jgi:hypothetical protein
MVSISCWGEKDCSYRTMQRFFGEQFPNMPLYWQFFVSQLYRSEREHLLAAMKA